MFLSSMKIAVLRKYTTSFIYSTPRVGKWCKMISGPFFICFRKRKPYKQKPCLFNLYVYCVVLIGLTLDYVLTCFYVFLFVNIFTARLYMFVVYCPWEFIFWTAEGPTATYGVHWAAWSKYIYIYINIYK